MAPSFSKHSTTSKTVLSFATRSAFCTGTVYTYRIPTRVWPPRMVYIYLLHNVYNMHPSNSPNPTAATSTPPDSPSGPYCRPPHTPCCDALPDNLSKHLPEKGGRKDV